MMYPYMTLDDNTEITYSELKPNGKICVYVETPNKNGGFNNATCLLPENKWSDIKGYSDREMDFYKRLVRNNTNFIIASAQKEAVLEGTLSKCFGITQYREAKTEPFVDAMKKKNGDMVMKRCLNHVKMEVTSRIGTSICCPLIATSFISQVQYQLRGTGYYVFSGNVAYESNNGEYVIPDVSISLVGRMCNKDIPFFMNIPFVMAFVMDAEDRCTLKDELKIYEKLQVDECWVVNWPDQVIEIYSLEHDDQQGQTGYQRVNIVNSMENMVQLCSFQHVVVNVHDLFAEGNLYQ